MVAVSGLLFLACMYWKMCLPGWALGFVLTNQLK